VSLFEALMIYLSAGAPFGVLVFFSQRPPTLSAAAHSVLATVGWPVIAGQRIYRSVVRRNDRQQVRGDVSELEVLHGLAKEVPVETAELFEIAGHSNPWLATNCYARSRKNVVRSHIDRLEVATSSSDEEFEITGIPEYSTVATTAIGS